MVAQVRWADVLCPACTEDVLTFPTSWGQRWQEMTEQTTFRCSDCTSQVQDLLARHNDYFTIKRSLDHLSQPTRRGMIAAHEAGHAAVGLEFGYPLVHAYVDEQSQHDQPPGQVRWNFAADTFLRPIEYGATTLAGMLAQERWLRDQGIPLTDADRVEIYQGSYEDLLTLHEVTGGIPERAWEVARDVVNATWPGITQLTEELSRHGQLDANAIQHALRPSESCAQPIPAPAAAAASTTHTPSTGGTDMSGIDEIRSTLSRATEETEQAQHALAQAMQLVDNARAAVAQVAQTSSRDEIQQVLAQYGHVGDSLRELGGRMAASVDQVRTYAAQL